MKLHYKLTVNDIARAIDMEKGYSNAIIDNVSWNSKEISKNGCFFAIKGKKHNGNDYINEAIKNGASLIISDEDVYSSVEYIKVNNVVDSLCRIARYYAKNVIIIAVTGSAGKTTVKEMIKAVLSQKYKVTATKENENNEIGVAKTLLSVNEEEICVIEMGMRALGEIKYISGICLPQTSVITNCGSAHIERLGSKENIFRAKTEILENTISNCILPNENRFLNVEKYDLNTIFVGDNGNMESKEIEYNKEGTEFSVFENNTRLGRIFLPSLSNYNVTNALFAYSVGRLYGVEHNEIKNARSNFKNIGYRENILRVAEITFVLDCYNASYEGVRESIKGFCNYCHVNGYRPNLILGCMREIGDGSYEYHYRIGEYARDMEIKTLIAYGHESSGYIDGFTNGIIFYDKKNIAEHILSRYCKRDAFLVKGSRSEKLEEIIYEMKELLK